MYHTNAGSYDVIPEAMEIYINNYGCHFNKKLCEEASDRMYYKKDGVKHKIKPYTKEQVDELLRTYNIKVDRNKLYDAVYVANMCKADFLNRSIIDERHLAQYVKDLLDDDDAKEGFVFNRFYADTMFMNDPIEWEDMI